MPNLVGDSGDPNVAAISGTHSASASGVSGKSRIGPGVHGVSQGTDPNHPGFGVWGEAIGAGVVGHSKQWMGVFGTSESSTGGHGVMGRATGGGAGVAGESTKGIGVFAKTESGEAGLRAENKGGGFAGFFLGKVGVTGELNVNGNINTLGDFKCVGSDIAEEFEVIGDLEAEPGSVVVLAGQDQVRVSTRPYDRLVAGVVSGAGNFRPGLLLGLRQGTRRQPLALTGRVWVKADAGRDPIQLGDLLTTSSVPGHAMRVMKDARSFGCVLGKALAELPSGRGLIPVLVSLQ